MDWSNVIPVFIFLNAEIYIYFLTHRDNSKVGITSTKITIFIFSFITVFLKVNYILLIEKWHKKRSFVSIIIPNVIPTLLKTAGRRRNPTAFFSKSYTNFLNLKLLCFYYFSPTVGITKKSV